MKLSLDGRDYEVEVEDGAVTVNGARYQVSLSGRGPVRIASVNGRAVNLDVGEVAEGGERPVNVDGKVYSVRTSGSDLAPPAGPKTAATTATARAAAPRPTRGAVTAQMTGRVLRVNVAAGESVAEGAPLLVLEAMKMENEIRAPRAGTIKSVEVSEGSRVSAGDALVVFEV